VCQMQKASLFLWCVGVGKVDFFVNFSRKIRFLALIVRSIYSAVRAARTVIVRL
jgi:hypothetical protein